MDYNLTERQAGRCGREKAHGQDGFMTVTNSVP